MQGSRKQQWTRRRYFRFREPTLEVELNGLTAQADDWSLGGVGLTLSTGQSACFQIGGSVCGHLTPPKGGEPIAFAGRIVHLKPGGRRMGLEFKGLSDHAVDGFAAIFRAMKYDACSHR